MQVKDNTSNTAAKSSENERYYWESVKVLSQTKHVASIVG